MLSRKLSQCIFDKTKTTLSTMPQWKFWTSSTSVQKTNDRSAHTNAETTVNNAEIELFSKQMNEWWDLNGKLKLLHRFNTVRVPLVRDGLIECTNEERELFPLKNKTILDVGCGGGILSEGLARIGAQVTGIDASKDLIELADQHKHVDPKIAQNKPTYYNVTIEEHAKQYANHYDAVIASEVIEHVNNPEMFVKMCVETVKPGGKVFFTTPNRTRLSQFTVIFLVEDVLRFVEKGTHQYEKFITPNELSFMLERNNCQIEASLGFQYNPLSQRWSFSRFQHIMYAIQAKKLN